MLVLLRDDGGGTFDVGGEQLQALVYQVATILVFGFGLQLRIAGGVRYRSTDDDPVDTQHLSDVRDSRYLYSGDADSFDLSRNR